MAAKKAADKEDSHKHAYHIDVGSSEQLRRSKYAFLI
jgi:hypothetical protein